MLLSAMALSCSSSSWWAFAAACCPAAKASSSPAVRFAAMACFSSASCRSSSLRRAATLLPRSCAVLVAICSRSGNASSPTRASSMDSAGEGAGTRICSGNSAGLPWGCTSGSAAADTGTPEVSVTAAGTAAANGSPCIVDRRRRGQGQAPSSCQSSDVLSANSVPFPKGSWTRAHCLASSSSSASTLLAAVALTSTTRCCSPFKPAASSTPDASLAASFRKLSLAAPLASSRCMAS
mmetsp:Transcript_14181/g.39261  ORF Transcript_14181/g.39261 Transcript_14181/m.39261 type:complete len:237 (+) Transcript_14181:798-1508(+)